MPIEELIKLKDPHLIYQEVLRNLYNDDNLHAILTINYHYYKDLIYKKNFYSVDNMYSNNEITKAADKIIDSLDYYKGNIVLVVNNIEKILPHMEEFGDYQAILKQEMAKDSHLIMTCNEILSLTTSVVSGTDKIVFISDDSDWVYFIDTQQ